MSKYQTFKQVVTLIGLLCLIGLAMFQFYENLKLKQEIKKCDLKVETFQMHYQEQYNMFYNESWKATGIFFGDYFAVWTKNRTWAEVMETCNHEYLHYKFAYNWEHFDKDNH